MCVIIIFVPGDYGKDCAVVIGPGHVMRRFIDFSIASGVGYRREVVYGTCGVPLLLMSIVAVDNGDNDSFERGFLENGRCFDVHVANGNFREPNGEIRFASRRLGNLREKTL